MKNKDSTHDMNFCTLFYFDLNLKITIHVVQNTARAGFEA